MTRVKRARVASSTPSVSCKTKMPPTQAVLSEAWHRRRKDEDPSAAEQDDATTDARVSYSAEGAAGGGKAATQSAEGALLTRETPSVITALSTDCKWEEWTMGGTVPLDLTVCDRPRKCTRRRSPAAALRTVPAMTAVIPFQPAVMAVPAMKSAFPEDRSSPPAMTAGWRSLPIFGRESRICWLPPPSPPA